MTLASRSVDQFKNQAKKLREFLAKSGTEISHSACLEAVAMMHGFRDWNVASAATKEELKLFIVCCTFSAPDDDRLGEFQYLIPARNVEEAEILCRLKFSDFLGKVDAFIKGTWINIHYVIEVNDVAAGGALINWSSTAASADNSSISPKRICNPLPLGKGESVIDCYELTDSEPRKVKGEVPPFVELGSSK